MEPVSNVDPPPEETEKPPAILTVEDDEGLRLLFQRSFTRDGFYSHGVSKGSDAIAWLTSHDCALLLLDYRLPDMTGEEVIRTLRKKGLEIPFIVCSGLRDEAAAEEMLKLGARDYLVKGRTFFDRLRLSVRAALGHFTVEDKSFDRTKPRHDSK